ncbi:hypothetical protein BDK92_3301 [Micromonospora pisi]|uniref:Copper(I)-binding protein n=1 Tax=Micromonospora pisi TaxID=589240 RepID=A0A495JJ75_9ACTN|nr:hypothetical protein [Micromonospora pisi]RKR88967.1 hypothetical protein BDK92_3301 [Micromonospora pisi]
MTRSIRRPRRVALLLGGAATASALLLSGCGTGQIAETAAMRPTVSGINTQTGDNAFKLRNLAVVYKDTKGYPAGSDAPLEVSIYNDSMNPVTVTVTTTSARAVVLGGKLAPSPQPSPSSASPSPSGSPSASGSPSVNPSGSGTPSGAASGSPSGAASPSPSATSAAPVDRPASIQIPAHEFVVLNPTNGSFLQLAGLSGDLKPGQSVQLVFDFGGQRIETAAPVAIPLTPAPVATPVVPEGEGEGHGG